MNTRQKILNIIRPPLAERRCAPTEREIAELVGIRAARTMLRDYGSGYELRKICEQKTVIDFAFEVADIMPMQWPEASPIN